MHIETIGVIINAVFITAAALSIIYCVFYLIKKQRQEPDAFTRAYAQFIREVIDEHIMQQAIAMGWESQVNQNSKQKSES